MPKTFYQITKNEKHTIKNKTNKKSENNLGQHIFWVQRLYAEFRPEKMKMTNKVLREKPRCVVC